VAESIAQIPVSGELNDKIENICVVENKKKKKTENKFYN
jgi:hypothetical protein